MVILKDRFFILSLFTGLLIRLFLSPIQGFKFDVDTWFAWAQRLNSFNFSSFYSDTIWTGYPPGFLYILSFLGFIKNLFQITDSTFYILLKFPSIIAEIILGIIIYKIIPKEFVIWRKIALIFVIFNPSFVFNSAIFGQFDGLFSLTVLLSVYFLIKKRLVFSSIFWGVSFLLKPQAVLLGPVFLFYMLKNFSIKNIITISLSLILTILIAFLPFFPNNIVLGPINIVTNLLDFYPFNSIFAYNLWGILGFWIKDSNNYLNITYQNWGYILFVLFLSLIFFYGRRRKLSQYSIASLSSLGFFFLLTRMHERYLYPSLVFLIIVFAFRRSKLLAILTAILSLLHFLDLYYVYIYYNQFFLKLPEIIYLPYIYNFANNNIALISFISTVVFGIISINILINNESKQN